MDVDSAGNDDTPAQHNTATNGNGEKQIMTDLHPIFPSADTVCVCREVDLGPFKHKIDDGLELRKAAFECMDVLLERCKDRINMPEFITHLEQGLQVSDRGLARHWTCLLVLWNISFLMQAMPLEHTSCLPCGVLCWITDSVATSTADLCVCIWTDDTPLTV